MPRVTSSLIITETDEYYGCSSLFDDGRYC
jgi:hypothetical protein